MSVPDRTEGVNKMYMPVSTARSANDALAAAGEEPDWLGDAACNSGEHTTRHHATNRAWRDALAAVATGTVLLGDKQEAERYKQYNADHVPDIVQVGASAWGTDWLGRQVRGARAGGR